MCDRNVAALMDEGQAWEMTAYEQEALARVIELGSDYDVVHSHISWGGFVLSTLPEVGRKVLHTLHNPVTPDVEWYLAHRPDLRLTVVSEFQARKLSRVGVRHCEVIPNGIRVDRFPFSGVGGELLVFLGRMEHAKGPDLAISVARQAGLPLVLAGATPDPDYFAQQIEPQLDERIAYAGILGHDAKCELLGRAGCTVMPSRWEEPFGLVAIESQACGTPVVALANGALPEIIEPGATGYLAEDEAEVGGLIARARVLDREVVRARAAARFGIEPVARSYLNLYRSWFGA